MESVVLSPRKNVAETKLVSHNLILQNEDRCRGERTFISPPSLLVPAHSAQWREKTSIESVLVSPTNLGLHGACHAYRCYSLPRR